MTLSLRTGASTFMVRGWPGERGWDEGHREVWGQTEQGVAMSPCHSCPHEEQSGIWLSPCPQVGLSPLSQVSPLSQDMVVPMS